MVLDYGVFSKGFGPEEVSLTENASEKPTSNAEEDEDQIMDWVIIDSVVGFEEDKLSCPRGIQGFEDDRCKKRANEGSPEDFPWEVCTDFLRDLVRSVGDGNCSLTSYENKTPPIGAPNATLRPDEQATLSISRILRPFCRYL